MTKLFAKQNDKKITEDDLNLTLNYKIDLARLTPCLSNLLPQINRYYRLAFHKLADEPFAEAQNLYDEKQRLAQKPKELFGTDLVSRTHSSQRFDRNRRYSRTGVENTTFEAKANNLFFHDRSS